MAAVKSAPKNTGNVITLSKYDKIAVEKQYGCIKNGKRVKKKKYAINKKGKTKKGFQKTGNKQTKIK